MVKVAVSKPSKLKNRTKDILPSLKTESSVSTDKQLTTRSRDHLIKPGQCLNPAGRPKGSRNKLSESFVSDMLRDWEIGGQAAIQQVRLNDPSTYLRVVAGLIPKEFKLKDNREQDLEKFLAQLTDEQYEEYERAVAAILAIPVNGSAGS